ncbi:MAG: vitamin K epoxide reductase family protein [bacterium]
MSKLLLIVAVLGLLVSGYLLLSYQRTDAMLCFSGHGCDDVRASNFSSILGVPTPLFGVAYYFGLGVLAALWTPQEAGRFKWSLIVVTAIGLAVSAVLTYLEAFVIKAWCSWCLTSASLSAIAFLLVWFRLSTKDSYENNK